jgi:predicted GNAT family acetyltransferase
LMRWQGIGSELVERAIAYLTTKWYKVTATCSYSKNWLEKNKK